MAKNKKEISENDKNLIIEELRCRLGMDMQMLLPEGVLCGKTTTKAEERFKNACKELITMSLLNKSATMFEMVG